jgi:hypothetical protein
MIAAQPQGPVEAPENPVPAPTADLALRGVAVLPVRNAKTSNTAKACGSCGQRPARPKRARRVREAAEFSAMVRRQVRALTGRACEGDLTALSELSKIQREIEDELARAVGALRGEAWAYPLSALGQALGQDRSTVLRRFPDATGVRPVGGQPGRYR